ncbi:MAG: MarR family transcriptional regulator [Actinomycetota bacterium]|nr:MarR family transcriptional regulator [Actinomycetota bacterium]
MTPRPLPPVAGEDVRRGTAAEVIDLLWELVGNLRGHTTAVATEMGLSPGQLRALVTLQAPAPMRELASRMACDPSNVTGLVDGLERRGLVARQPHPEDRRVRQLVFTDEGERLRQALRDRLYGHALGIADLSEADQRHLRDLLTRALRH